MDRAMPLKIRIVLGGEREFYLLAYLACDTYWLSLVRCHYSLVVDTKLQWNLME